MIPQFARAGKEIIKNKKTAKKRALKSFFINLEQIKPINMSLLFFNYITKGIFYDILKKMNKIKKFWILFLSFLPFGAGAVAPLVIGGIAGVGVIAGFSIYRSYSPVDMASALNFFSSCWSCQLFYDIMSAMSNLLPRAYSAIGKFTIPILFGLTSVWFAWKLLSGYLGIKGKVEPENPWGLSGFFGTHVIKLVFVAALLAAPLPKLLTSVVIEPIFNIGLSVNHIISDNNKFSECVVATAVADPVSVDARAAEHGAYSPKLRHNLACELGNAHQITGLGMTVGWTMMNMAFNDEYMHKILWNVPFFPNIPILLGGVLILVLFFVGLLPIPMYFLQVFITLSLDLIMLPFMLMSWLFSDWKIFGNSGKTIKSIIDDVVKNTCGIALVCIFLTFSIMFLNAVFGDWAGASALRTAIENNDSLILMDSLMMNNDSLITIVLMGLFIAMFMNMIPALVKTLFSNVEIPEKFYEDAKKDINTLWANAKNWYKGIKK